MTFWFVAGALVLIAELFAGTVYLLVVGAALFGAGIAAALGGSVPVAVLTAALLSALGILPVHKWVKKHRRSQRQEAEANDLDIGQTVQILRHLHGDVYEVAYRGAHWQAKMPGGKAAAQTGTAVITGKDGNILLLDLHSI
ncbi:NfeD family protein [Neisseria animalis]|uniref:NfeD family protein n=1 Tax=Neisseria animalis TaxID=492 RepID=A0A5P3MTM6_NEIAN|nr:NfeD family protein [Neisseria animalis]QEY24830.1 NfeD family protein [Neisseria animalis]ROW31571.1 NfeD family protein [Neisseria animalis]VEE07950.1 nodulation efficiency NfeD family protein [Neisseria animalis]